VYSYPGKKPIGYFSLAGYSAWPIPAPRWPETIGEKKLCSNPVFSSDSKRIFCGFPDGTIRCWDIVEHKLVFAVQAHTGRVRRLALDPEGKFLISSGVEQDLVLWEV